MASSRRGGGRRVFLQAADAASRLPGFRVWGLGFRVWGLGFRV